MVFSLEMSAFQLVERLLYARARFDKSRIMKGFDPVKQDLLKIKKASEDINNCKLFIDDTAGISINELREKARRKKKEEEESKKEEQDKLEKIKKIKEEKAKQVEIDKYKKLKNLGKLKC